MTARGKRWKTKAPFKSDCMQADSTQTLSHAMWVSAIESLKIHTHAYPARIRERSMQMIFCPVSITNTLVRRSWILTGFTQFPYSDKLKKHSKDLCKGVSKNGDVVINLDVFWVTLIINCLYFQRSLCNPTVMPLCLVVEQRMYAYNAKILSSQCIWDLE